eukprot:gene17823-19604_t
MGLRRLLIFLISVFELASQKGTSLSPSKCEPITIPLCQDIKYNKTIFPNLLSHRNQEEAGLEVHQFFPLVKVKCSQYLNFFLCSVYVPICTELFSTPIPPCRSLCKVAKNDCLPLMLKFGFGWPESLSCERYPEMGSGNLCVGKNFTKSESGGGGDGGTASGGGNKNGGNTGGGSTTGGGGKKTDSTWPGGNGNRTLPNIIDGKPIYKCPSNQTKREDKHYNFMGVTECAAECKSIYFLPKEREFARNWILFWSLVCILSTTFSLATYFIDSKRFHYPYKPIIFLCGCFFVIAVVYVAGYIADKGIACHKTKSNVLLLNQGTENAGCTVVFMFLYFFTMASAIWWVILTLTWFLAAGMKWSHEAIESNSQYFHAAAWAIPAAKTIAILAMHEVDGDELSGVCFVGGSNLLALRGFVIAPLFVYLLLGTFFLLAGFISLVRIRSVLKHDQSLKTDKLTRLMVRIGVFSVLYTLPAIIVIACLFYEQAYRPDWDRSWLISWFKIKFFCVDKFQKNCPTLVIGEDRPDFAVYMIKYLMMLMVGITSGFWIWSGKTLLSWKKFYYSKILKRPLPKGNSTHGHVVSSRTNV